MKVRGQTIFPSEVGRSAGVGADPSRAQVGSPQIFWAVRRSEERGGGGRQAKLEAQNYAFCPREGEEQEGEGVISVGPNR